MDKKEQIILAAMKLLVLHGEQNTPMSAIAREANTGMGTIYNYFGTKDDLINAIYLHIKHEELKAVNTPDNNAPVKKQFEHFYQVQVQYMINHPTHFSFIEYFGSSPIILEATRKAGAEAFSFFMDVLKEGQRQGIIKSVSLQELVQFIHGGFRGFIRWILASGRPLTKELLDNQLRIAWDAIKE